MSLAEGLGPQATASGQVSCEQDLEAQWEESWEGRVRAAIRCMDISFEEHFFQILQWEAAQECVPVCQALC